MPLVSPDVSPLVNPLVNPVLPAFIKVQSVECCFVVLKLQLQDDKGALLDRRVVSFNPLFNIPVP